ncbi:MAG TPA: DUF4398 domain-containing protein, partial [Polyangiaceae bacterium]|nr:DUF4398 domain-containing protein [Polyangiaceae bacterium]
MTPAQLDTAKQALDSANRSFEENGDDESTLTLAYIAKRKARIAAAQGEIAAATQRRDQAARELQAAQLADGDRAKKNLEKTKAELADQKRKAEQDINEKQAELKQKQAELAQKEKEVAKTKQQLEDEKQARLAAEKKLTAAMASLAEIAKVKEEKRGVVITISGEVLFASGKYTLLPIAQS